jgi:2,6-dihydroxypyridine 3-monooxygenase
VLTAALEQADSIEEALAAFDRRQVKLGRDLVERVQKIGNKSQVDNSWIPGDPELLFGLHRAGET